MVQDLIQDIRLSEQKIKDVQLHLTCTAPSEDNRLLYEADWGYDQGKEYCKDFRRGKNPEEPLQLETVTSTTFDGEKTWHLHHDLTADRLSGSVRRLRAGTSHMWMLTLNRLLGFKGDAPLRPSLAETLTQAQSVKIRRKESIQRSRPCVVIEVEGVVVDPASPTRVQDMRVWIDPERDYRPLRIETYSMRTGPRLFTYLRNRLDILEFQQVDDIWLPVMAENSDFLRGGRLSQGIHRVRFDRIQLNLGIPASAFVLDFPEGCEVRDDVLNTHYIKGQASEQEATLTDEQWRTQARALSVPELIKVIQEGKPFMGQKKWFAAIYRLVEMGSTNIPQIVSALENENRALAQSLLALALRAIGDATAVPGLINALERCGFCSDFGMGEAKSPLEIFYRKHQINPSDPDLRLGRPVREITLALEQLTGHTEGDAHYHSYDENGQRLGSHTVTPELRDRDRAMRKAVAQRWRLWWNQQPVGQQTKRTNLGPWTESLSLECHVAVKSDQDVTAEALQRCRDQLQKEGPYEGRIRGDSYQWHLVDSSVTSPNSMITEVYRNKSYVLLCARQPFSLWSPTPQTPWGLAKAEAVTDTMGRPAVSIELDTRGVALLEMITQHNVDRFLAILVEGQVVSALQISTALRKHLTIEGNFRAFEIEQMVTTFNTHIPKIARLRNQLKTLVNTP